MVVMMMVTLAGLLDILLQACVGLLCGREVARLQRRSQGVEGLRQSAAALERARNILTQYTEIRLGFGKVSRLEILSQLLKLALNLLRPDLPALHTLSQGVA